MPTVDQLIDSLESKITDLFIELFAETEEPLNINTWEDRFKLVSTNGAGGSTFLPENWTITFEDTQSPFAQFNLHMNRDQPEDFSIDT